MPALIASILAHSLRVVFAALAAAAIWLVVSFLLGMLVLPHVAKSATAVGVIAVVLATAAFCGGGYISARYITPDSLVHAGAGGFLLTQAYLFVGSSGPWYAVIIFPLTAGVLAVVGACFARWQHRRRSRAN